MAGRNFMFDRGLRRIHRLPVPVLSVGNLSVGGTGKTPLVMWLVALLQGGGFVPGVLARGYRRAPGEALNDEGKLLASHFKALPQVQDPDRVRGGKRLMEQGVDVIVLDDGFQHRRLHRDLDIVCLDAARPFCDGILLPAGDLREPPTALKRAQMAILTRASAISSGELTRQMETVRRSGGDAMVIHAADHVPVALVQEPSKTRLPLSFLRGARVLLLSGIGNPASFEASVRSLGAIVVRHVRQADHHHHTATEVGNLAVEAEDRDLVLVTTEKDDVKLAPLGVSRLVLQIELRFLSRAPTLSELLP